MTIGAIQRPQEIADLIIKGDTHTGVVFPERSLQANLNLVGGYPRENALHIEQQPNELAPIISLTEEQCVVDDGGQLADIVHQEIASDLLEFAYGDTLIECGDVVMAVAVVRRVVDCLNLFRDFCGKNICHRHEPKLGQFFSKIRYGHRFSPNGDYF